MYVEIKLLIKKYDKQTSRLSGLKLPLRIWEMFGSSLCPDTQNPHFLHGFPGPLRDIVGIAGHPKSGHDRFLVHPFQIIFPSTTYHCTDDVK